MTPMMLDAARSWIRFQAKSPALIGAAAFSFFAVLPASASQLGTQVPAPNALKALALKKIDQCLRRTATYLDSAEARRERLCQISGCAVYLRMCSTSAEQLMMEKTHGLIEHHASQITQDCRDAIDAMLEPWPKIAAEDHLPFETGLEAPTLALAYRYELMYRMVHAKECRP